jgi:AcrR family transcriptional regulator
MIHIIAGPTMRAEKQNSESRKRQIAGAAMSLIARQGVKGLSVAAVARKVGLVPSALYRHFKGKEEILEATIQLVRDLIVENVKSVRRESPEPLDQIKRLVMLQIQMIQEFQAIPRIVFSDEISASHPLRRTTIYRIIQEILDQVAEMVVQGQQQGQIKTDLNPETVSVMLLGLVQPPAILWYLSKGRFDISKHMERAWPIFEKALREKAPEAFPIKKGRKNNLGRLKGHQP